MTTKFVNRDGKIQVYINGRHVGKISGFKDNYRLVLLNGGTLGLWTYASDAKRDIRARTAQILTLLDLEAKFPAGRVTRVCLPGAPVDGACCVVISTRVGGRGPEVKVRLTDVVGTLPAGELLSLPPSELA